MAEELPLAGVTLGTSGVSQAVSSIKDMLGELLGKSKETAEGFKLAWETVLGAELVHKATEFFGEVISASERAEQAQLKLAAVLHATGEASGVTASQIRELGEELQRNTLFKSEEIENAAAVLATYTSVQNEHFSQAIKLSADLASLLGGDVSNAARQLGRALEDPEHGLNALRRAGIVFTAAERDQIKALQDAGDLYGAQTVILDKLEGKVSGLAEQMHSGLAGSIADVKHAWEDFLASLNRPDSKIGEFLRTELRGATNILHNVTGGADPNSDAAIQKQIEALQPKIRKYVEPELDREGVQGNTYHDALTGLLNKQPATGTYLPDRQRAIELLQQMVELEDRLAYNAAIEDFNNKKAAASAKAAAQERSDSDQAERDAQAAKKAALAEAERAKSVAELIDRLRDKAIASDVSADAAIRQEVADRGGTAADQEMAAQYQQTIDDNKLRAESIKHAEEAQKQATQTVEDYIRHINDETAALQGNTMANDAAAKAHAASAYDPVTGSRVTQAETALNFAKAQQQQEDYEKQKAQQTLRLFDAAGRGISESFARTFDETLTGRIRSFSQFSRQILSMWASMLSQMASRQLGNALGSALLGAVGSGVGGWTSADAAGLTAAGSSASSIADNIVMPGLGLTVEQYHSGGTVGVDGLSRSVAAAIFSGAPRLHSGLMADEFPAILQRGESVLTPGQMDAMGGTHVHLHVHAIDSRDTKQFIAENADSIAQHVGDAVFRNRAFQKRITRSA